MQYETAHGSLLRRKSEVISLLYYPVYTLQPVVNPVWQPAVSCKQTMNRLSNRFDNRLNVCIHDTTGCQTGLTTGCIVPFALLAG